MNVRATAMLVMLFVVSTGMVGCDSSESGDRESAEEESTAKQPVESDESESEGSEEGAEAKAEESGADDEKGSMHERMHSMHEELIDRYEEKIDHYKELEKSLEDEKLKSHVADLRSFHDKEVEMYSSKKKGDDSKEKGDDGSEKEGEGGGSKSDHVEKMAKKMHRAVELHATLADWANNNDKAEVAEHHEAMREGYAELADMHDKKAKMLKEKEGGE